MTQATVEQVLELAEIEEADEVENKQTPESLSFRVLGLGS